MRTASYLTLEVPLVSTICRCHKLCRSVNPPPPPTHTHSVVEWMYRKCRSRVLVDDTYRSCVYACAGATGGVRIWREQLGPFRYFCIQSCVEINKKCTTLVPKKKVALCFYWCWWLLIVCCITLRVWEIAKENSLSMGFLDRQARKGKEHDTKYFATVQELQETLLDSGAEV